MDRGATTDAAGGTWCKSRGRGARAARGTVLAWGLGHGTTTQGRQPQGREQGGVGVGVLGVSSGRAAGGAAGTRGMGYSDGGGEVGVGCPSGLRRWAGRRPRKWVEVEEAMLGVKVRDCHRRGLDHGDADPQCSFQVRF